MIYASQNNVQPAQEVKILSEYIQHLHHAVILIFRQFSG